MPKDRSPNYPAHDLADSLEYARKMYASEGRSAAPPPVIAKAIGYSGLNGAVRQKIGALRQFGLVEKAAQGKLQISSLAVRLLTHAPTDPEFKQLIQEAALAPPLFRELREKLPEASDHNLVVYLINEKGFSPEGAQRVVKAYRATTAFANVGAGGYNGSSAEANGKAKTPPGDAKETSARVAEEARHPDGQRHRETSDVVYSWPLEDADKVEVSFVGNTGKKPTRRDLEALIDYLELIKKRTPEAPPGRLRDLENESE